MLDVHLIVYVLCSNLFDVFLKPYFLEAYRPVHKGWYTHTPHAFTLALTHIHIHSRTHTCIHIYSHMHTQHTHIPSCTIGLCYRSVPSLFHLCVGVALQCIAFPIPLHKVFNLWCGSLAVVVLITRKGKLFFQCAAIMMHFY